MPFTIQFLDVLVKLLEQFAIDFPVFLFHLSEHFVRHLLERCLVKFWSLTDLKVSLR